MKKFLSITTVLFFAITVCAQPNTWVQKANYGGGQRQAASAFAINGKIYVCLGLNASAQPMNDLWEYDPVTNAWTRKADFPGTARYSAVAFTLNGKGYVGTGYNGSTYFKDFWQYDPATNTWTRKKDFAGQKRRFATGFVINNKGYLGCGTTFYPNEIFHKDFWEYDPAADVWTRKADFGGGDRSNARGFSIGNKGYMGTGYYNGWHTDFWEYNPATNAWLQKTDFGGAAREWAAAFSIGDKGYLGTGYAFAYYKDFWEFDPMKNTWTRKADFGGSARNNAIGISDGTKGYIGLGYNGSATENDLWAYCPALDTPGVIKGQKINLCGGGKFNYGIDTVPGAVYYTWTVPANTSIIAGQGSSTIRLNVQSNFKSGDISVVANNLCSSSAPSVVSLTAKPAKPSVISGPSVVMPYQQNIVFSVTDQNVIFNWTVLPIDAKITSGWGTNSITVTWGSTSGYVAVSASNNCGLSDSRAKAVAISGSHAMAKSLPDINDLFTINPNPAKSSCMLSFNSSIHTAYTLSVSDVNGKVILMKQGFTIVGENKIVIDVSMLSNGMYLISLTDKTGKHSLKFYKD